MKTKTTTTKASASQNRAGEESDAQRFAEKLANALYALLQEYREDGGEIDNEAVRNASDTLDEWHEWQEGK